MNLDEQLKFGLRRKEPPVGFADRVLAEVAGTSGNATSRPVRGHRDAGYLSWWRSVTRRWILAGALASLTIATVLLQQQRHRAEGEAAKEQLMLALRITSSKLNEAQRMVQEQNETGRH
ncbi:MAG TPA: hypothetical protein VGK99_08145 [Acidobacteriota bacterium]